MTVTPIRPTTLIAALVFTFATVSNVAQASEVFSFSLECGSPPPNADSTLARLFEFAETTRGAAAEVEIEFNQSGCSCSTAQSDEPVRMLELACDLNPNWWFASRLADYHCLRALGMAGHTAGLGTFCFPKAATLERRAGYVVEQSATSVTIRGVFKLNWEWSLGAPHVQLLMRE